MGPEVALASIAVIPAVLLAILLAAFVVGLLVLGLGLVFRVLGILIRAVLAVIGVVVGGAIDLLVAVLSVIPILLNAGFALALVVFGRWTSAESRAARIQTRLDSIGGRLAHAAWRRPASLARWVARGPTPQRVEPASAARVDRAATWTPPPPPPPPPRIAPDSPIDPPDVPAKEREMATIAHLSALAGLLLPGANILGPLVVWLARKDSMPYVDEQGREAINFNITACIVGLLSLVVFVLAPVVAVAWIVLVIVAAVRAQRGERWRYPFCLRLVPPRVPASAGGVASTPLVAAGSGFPGYELVGSLPAGGSGARLHVAKPSATVARRLPAGIDRVVIKVFAFTEGSTLPQIVRESRAMDAATRLGLVLEHRLEPGRFWYAMPYYPGASFGDAVRSLHRMGPEDGLEVASLRRVLEWTTGLVATLDRYHRAGLWHKDVKPENVIVSAGEARLVDIGLVTSLSSGMTLTTHGTEYFRDPEMVRLALRGVKVHEVDGGRFDLYGVGAMLYLGIEDTFPAHGGLSGFGKRSPECVRWVVRRAMADYAKRYADAATMRRDLEAILAAQDPWSLKPAMLPSFRDEAAVLRSAVVISAAEPAADFLVGADRAGAPPIEELEDSRVRAASRGSDRRDARPRWGLTSSGGTRGAGRTVAALILFVVGLIVALVFASVLDASRDERGPARVLVIGPEGDLSQLFEGGEPTASLAEMLRPRLGEVEVVEAPARLAAAVTPSASGMASDPVATIRRELRRREQGESSPALRGVVVLDPDRGRATMVFARPGADLSWWDGAIELFTDSGTTWLGDSVDLSTLLPARPGSRVLLLRDPTATASLSNSDLALWDRLGIEIIEPDAADAAELAVWLAGDRTGPEVQEQVRLALERYDAVELCRIRESKPLSRGIEGEAIAMQAGTVSLVEASRPDAASRGSVTARRGSPRRRRAACALRARRVERSPSRVGAAAARVRSRRDRRRSVTIWS